MLVAGSIYKFEFVPVLSPLDGVYEVVSIISYNQYILDGGNCLTDLFEAEGLSESNYAPYAEEIIGDRVAYLSSKTIIRPNIAVPLCLFPTYPKTNLKPYNRLIIALDLGLFGEQVRLNSLINAIQQMALSSAGIENVPKLMSINTEWLTDSEYSVIKDAREALITNTVTYYSECIRLQNELNKANNKITDYEATLIAMQP